MSSVLQKKLSNEAPVSENIHALAPVWGQSLQRLSRLLEQSTGISVERTDFTINTTCRQKFDAHPSPAPLFYTAQCNSTDDTLIFRLSPDLITLLSAKLLDEAEEGVPQETGLLDLFLLEPFAIDITRILSETLGSYDHAHLLSPLAPGSKGLSLAETGFMSSNPVQINLLFELRDKAGEYAIMLACPHEALNEIGIQMQENLASHLIDTEDTWFPRIFRTVQEMPLEVSVTLDSIDLNIAECSRLTMGQVIDLPGTNLENLSININMGQTLQKIGAGKLGIANSQKAILLNTGIDDTFLGDLVDFSDSQPGIP